MQLRLRAGLKTDIELLAVRHDLLHHRPHLIDLDGVYDVILTLIIILLRRYGEAF